MILRRFTDAFRGQDELADSVNHLLVVGFYLVNLGFVAFALESRGIAADDELVEQLLQAAKRSSAVLTEADIDRIVAEHRRHHPA